MTSNRKICKYKIESSIEFSYVDRQAKKKTSNKINEQHTTQKMNEITCKSRELHINGGTKTITIALNFKKHRWSPRFVWENQWLSLPRNSC